MCHCFWEDSSTDRIVSNFGWSTIDSQNNSSYVPKTRCCCSSPSACSSHIYHHWTRLNILLLSNSFQSLAEGRFDDDSLNWESWKPKQWKVSSELAKTLKLYGAASWRRLLTETEIAFKAKWTFEFSAGRKLNETKRDLHFGLKIFIDSHSRVDPFALWWFSALWGESECLIGLCWLLLSCNFRWMGRSFRFSSPTSCSWCRQILWASHQSARLSSATSLWDFLVAMLNVHRGLFPALRNAREVGRVAGVQSRRRLCRCWNEQLTGAETSRRRRPTSSRQSTLRKHRQTFVHQLGLPLKLSWRRSRRTLAVSRCSTHTGSSEWWRGCNQDSRRHRRIWISVGEKQKKVIEERRSCEFNCWQGKLFNFFIVSSYSKF